MKQSDKHNEIVYPNSKHNLCVRAGKGRQEKLTHLMYRLTQLAAKDAAGNSILP